MKGSSLPFHLCFETLASPLRIRLIKALEEKPKTVSQLVRELKEEQSTVSHALRGLRDCNFVQSSVKGKERLYKLSDSFLSELPKARNLFSVLEAHYSKHCRQCSKAK